MTTPSSLFAALRPETAQVPVSGIGEIANYARSKEGIIQLWVGEGDQPTPAFIREAATRSLAAGETYYTWQRGLPELRAAISAYCTAHYGRELGVERYLVTGSGMQALQLAFTLTAGSGDEVLVPTPSWPNAGNAVSVRGATPVAVPMHLSNRGWTLDVDRLAAAITPKTRAMFINTPSNPTGWVATHDELRAILDLARRHGLWIVADEIYSRFYWRDDAKRAPSFHDIRDDNDRIIFVNTLSKNWAMTGWRAGWIEVDPSLGPIVESLIQYSTSGVPVFTQRAAIAALERGESFIVHQMDRALKARDTVCAALESTGRCRITRPDGAFYLFFGVDGLTDSRKLAFDLIDTAGVGLSPGIAFGQAGEGYMRLCYLRSQPEIERAAEKLRAGIMAL